MEKLVYFLLFKGVYIFLFLIFLAAAGVLMTWIGRWRIFDKAGVRGWKSLIPFYNQYLMLKICGFAKLFPLWLSGLLLDLLAFRAGYFLYVISFILLVGIHALIGIRLAHLFGKTAGYAAGLICLPPLFLFILGISKAEYRQS